MRLEIRYRNEFRYGEPARESHNLLRACPAETPHQQLRHYSVEVFPPARVWSYTDYWGTRVDEFGVREPHDVLRINAFSVVDTSAAPAPSGDGDVAAYADLRGEFVTYLQKTPHADWDSTIVELARSSIEGCDNDAAAVAAVCDAVHATLAYRPGTTYVGVPVESVLAQGQGVCQDFAHLALAMYRSVGIPARYVSGYLYAASQDDAVAPADAELEVQTHAWIEAYVPGHGWWALDPTNPQPVAELHVKIGHGRDYDDVMPLRGVYHGEASHELGVTVAISREALAQIDQ